ncbi:MAG: hypothetical protein OXT65_09830, partial [Alphaproteobacteria bacterium]|nr:hypothetical protein [Alphaproteobacteria bacterium]
MLKKGVIGYIAILVIGGFLGSAVYHKCYNDYDAALESYRRQSRKETQHAINKIETAFFALYRNMRMISQMPFIRQNGAKASTTHNNTQILDNIFGSLSAATPISSIYVIDIHDGRIANIAIRLGENGPENINASGLPYTNILSSHTKWLQNNYPNASAARIAAAPIISGHAEEKRMDDSAENDEGEEKKKTQLITILSMPFFNMEQNLAGMITVTLTEDAVTSLLLSDEYALVNTGIVYAAEPKEEEIAKHMEDSAQFIAQGKTDPNLLYSDALPITLNDPRSKWYLWSGHPNSYFYNSFQVRAVQSFQITSFAFIFCLTAMGLFLWTSIQRRLGLIHKNFEDTIRAAEDSSRSKFGFLERMSEDLKPPLKEIAQAAQELALDKELSTKHKEDVNFIRLAAESLFGVVD